MIAYPAQRERAKLLLLEAIDAWRDDLAEGDLEDVALDGYGRDLSAHMTSAAWAVYEASADAGADGYRQAEADSEEPS